MPAWARGPPSRRTHPKWEPSPEQLARMRAATEQLLAHLLRPTTRYRPDIEALRAASTRIVVAGGATSKGQLANRTAVALADQLGTTLVVDFPVTTADSWPSLSSSAASWTRCSPKRPDRLLALAVDGEPTPAQLAELIAHPTGHRRTPVRIA